MKKTRLPKVDTAPSVNADSFKSSVELPTVEAVNDAVSMVTQKSMPTPEKVGETVLKIVAEMEISPKAKKRVTAKGTQSFTLMIDRHTAAEARMKALQTGVTFSDLVTTALMQYLRNS